MTDEEFDKVIDSFVPDTEYSCHFGCQRDRYYSAGQGCLCDLASQVHPSQHAYPQLF